MSRVILCGAVALAALASPSAWAQSPTPNIAELRQVIAVRDAQASGDADATIKAAQAYLAEREGGRYVDEVLLALAQSHAKQEQPEQALQTYERIIEELPDSPFREQAITESLPILQAQGDQARAFDRVDQLVQAYPNSLRRSEALLWKARTQYEADEHKPALATLKRINPEEDLAPAQEGAFYRLQTLALIKSGESAWTPLQRYLKRDDSPEHKAEVLMLVGDTARHAERPEEALRFYRQLVEDYPVPAVLDDALYWRAELFARTRLGGDAPDEVRAARRETAIGYYAGYLQTGYETHRTEALVGRGGLLKAAGRHDLALQDYQQAIDRNPELRGDPKVVRAQVELHQQLGQPEQAVALLSAIRQDETLSAAERTSFQVQQAALHYEAEQCEEVETLLNPMPIIADAQQRPRAFFMRGFCRYQRGEWEKATFDLEGLINDPAYQDLALEPLLAAYEKSGQSSRLVNLAEELLQAGRVEPTPALLDRLASGYEALGEPALMLSVYQRLEQSNPQAFRAPAVQLRMGQARERLGEQNAAIGHYQSVLNPAEDVPPPTDEEYLTALEHLQGLYLEAGNVEPLAALHKAAEARISADAGKARLTALKRDVDVAEAAQAVQAGRAKDAVPILEGVFAETSGSRPERRAKVAALLMTAYARSGAADQAEALYGREREAGEDETYRALLATRVFAAVEQQTKGTEDKAVRSALIPLYRNALTDLPEEQSKQRREAAQVLDGLYKQNGDHAGRAALVTALLKDGLTDEEKRDLRLYQSEIYRDWGQTLLEQKDYEAAQFQLERGLQLAQEGDWRLRYGFVSLLSRAQLAREQYTELVLLNESLLPEIEDKSLSDQVRTFLGQVYVQWGKAAEKDSNTKSAQIRYGYALDYLPESDWQRRLAATNGLAKIHQEQGRPGEAATAYEAVLPQIQDSGVHQQYALYLGRLYAERVNDASKAAEWLKVADKGGNDALSVEAGYLWADQQLTQNHADVALSKLTELVGRDIEATQWAVPVHYRIAVLHHQRKELRRALEHYRLVAGATHEDVRRLYPRSIEQSKQQVQQIERYLKNSSGGDIAVPRIRPD